MAATATDAREYGMAATATDDCLFSRQYIHQSGSQERELAGYHCTVGSDITVLYLLRAEIHLPSSRNLDTVPYKSWTQKRLLNGLCIFQALWLPPPSREESQNQNNTAEAHRATTLKFALFSKPFLKKVRASDDCKLSLDPDSGSL